MNCRHLVATILLTGCSVAGSRPGDVAVRLVDSVPWTVEFGMDASGVLHRVAVDYAGRTDTLKGILTALPPVLVGDSVIFGFSFREAELLAGFRYDLREHALTIISVPSEVSESQPALSPYADRLAYWYAPGDGTAALVIRHWPAGSELYRSASIGIPATDALLSQVRWVDSTTLRWRLEIPGDRAIGGTWSATSGLATNDTVSISVSP
jgi:hypothetical protein